MKLLLECWFLFFVLGIDRRTVLYQFLPLLCIISLTFNKLPIYQQAHLTHIQFQWSPVFTHTCNLSDIIISLLRAEVLCGFWQEWGRDTQACIKLLGPNPLWRIIGIACQCLIEGDIPALWLGFELLVPTLASLHTLA